MILDICYKNYAPEQIQNVRMVTLYPNKDRNGAKPELVIHFKAPAYGQQNINIKDIKSVKFTED